MSRIKGTVIKRTTEELLRKYPTEFTPSFEKNKKLLGNLTKLKKTRNSIAGYLARLIKKQKQQ